MDTLHGKNNGFSIEFLCSRDKENLINYLTVRNIFNLSKNHRFTGNDTSQLICHSNFTNVYLNTYNENILFVLTLLRDKCYQMFVEARKPLEPSYRRALQLVRTPAHLRPPAPGNELSADKVWTLVCAMLGQHVSRLAAYCQKLPGFDRIDLTDLATIIDQHTFAAIGLINSHLFIDGENYLMLNPDVQLTRHLMQKVLGPRFVCQIFTYHDNVNALGLSVYEIAAILPLILTSPGLPLVNPQPLSELNEYYKVKRSSRK
jgi:hypothetical protein